MRIKKENKPKHSRESELSFASDDLRWATNETVADYRASRLKCDVIVDIGCGIGFQALSFAKHCNKVYAIDIDEKKLEHAMHNAKALGIDNIEFIHGDALDENVIKGMHDVDIVFCDPERMPEEKERKLATIRPDVISLLTKYRSLTKKIAVEFPPQIKEIPFDCEREYVSLDGKLNRLTLYFGELKHCEASAVILPSGARLEKKLGTPLPIGSESVKKYLLEVDPAVAKAGLLGELSDKTGAELYQVDKQTFFTSDEPLKSPFFVSTFMVLASCPFRDESIIRALRKNGAGRVVLRYKIEPHKYWKERKSYEDALSGEQKLCLFKFGNLAVIAKLEEPEKIT